MEPRPNMQLVNKRVKIKLLGSSENYAFVLEP